MEINNQEKMKCPVCGHDTFSEPNNIEKFALLSKSKDSEFYDHQVEMIARSCNKCGYMLLFRIL